MRDEKRIEDILHDLGRLWKQHPDQRLGQLLENYVFPTVKAGGMMCSVTWFQEDDETQRKIIQETDFSHPKIVLRNNTKELKE